MDPHGRMPSLTLVDAAERIVRTVPPNYWVIENVRGATRYLTPRVSARWVLSIYLWGQFPRFRARVHFWKERLPNGYDGRPSAHHQSAPADMRPTRRKRSACRFDTADGPAWIPCPCCDDYWCVIHDAHAYDCDCPEIDEWTVNPYTTGAAE